MNAEMRRAQWSAVEQLLNASHLSVGADLPVRILVKARGEDSLDRLHLELAHQSFDVAEVQRGSWPFTRRRWVVANSREPLRIERAEVDRWLDRLDEGLKDCGGSVATWAPLVPGV